MRMTGGCYCGAIRYSIDGDPELAIQCHCRECLYFTGGQANTVMFFPKKGFKYTKGTPSTFTRSDLETPLTRQFCGNCGTPIGNDSISRPGMIIIKVGTLDDPSVFSPEVAIFTGEKLDFHHIPDGVTCFERRPQKKD